MGAEVRYRFLAAHTNAVIAKSERLLCGVRLIQHRKLGFARHQIRLAQRFEPKFVVGIRGVRDQLTQEDLTVAVKRMGS
jgi:hypothetical protein